MRNSEFSRAFRLIARAGRADLRRRLKRQAARAERRAGKAEARGQEAQAARYRCSRPTAWDVI